MKTKAIDTYNALPRYAKNFFEFDSPIKYKGDDKFKCMDYIISIKVGECPEVVFFHFLTEKGHTDILELS